MKKFLAILLIALVACAHVEETANEITEFEDPTLEYVPAGQDIQDDEPCKEYVPALHRLHLEDPLFE